MQILIIEDERNLAEAIGAGLKGAGCEVEILKNVIDVHVARIRRKVDDPFPQKLLHTVRGVGFVLGQARRTSCTYGPHIFERV